MWIEKHKPGNLSEIVGNNTVIERLQKCGWDKPVLLYGACGIGKTLTAHVLSDALNMELVEVTGENIDNAHLLSQTASLFGTKKLIVVDDVDVMKKIKAVSEFLKDTRSPTLLITSDFKSKRISTIKRMCEKISLRRPHPASIAKHLATICAKEGITADNELLIQIAKNSSGDVRSAVNDLEAIGTGKTKIVAEDLALIESRDKRADIYECLGKIFFGADISDVMRSLYDLHEQPKDILLWIDENLPLVYDNISTVQAYESISRADIFLGRISNRQYWGFLRYATPLMSGGVNVVKPKTRKFARYQFPSLIMNLSRTKKARSLKKSLGGKLSPHLHVSNKIVARQYIPLFKNLIEKKIIPEAEFADYYGLDAEEIEFILS